MDPALLSRFDLIFVLLDTPDEEIDQYLSEQILGKVSKNESFLSNASIFTFKKDNFFYFIYQRLG